MIERKFLIDAMKRLKASDYIKNELKKAGIVNIEIQRTTLATRISLIAERPGIVIGRKGKNIQDLAETVEKELGIENPQIEVNDVEVSSLEPIIIAKWMTNLLERGYKPKKVLQRALSRVMGAGAIGTEISLKGKIIGKGAKSRKQTVIKGYLKKAGEGVKNVKVAHNRANLKQGIIGVTVKIVPPNVTFPDKIDIKELLGKRMIEEKKKAESETEQIKKAKDEIEEKEEKKTKKKTVKKTVKKERKTKVKKKSTKKASKTKKTRKKSD